MSQPQWKMIAGSDRHAIFEDQTGVYEPEMEVAEEIGEKDGEPQFQVHRFILERQKIVEKDGTHYLVPMSYKPDYPHPIDDYEEWFVENLEEVASSSGASLDEITKALCSADPKMRALVYDSIGGHWGYDNLDTDPIIISESQLNERWS